MAKGENMIKVISNADDFGMSRVFNERILDLARGRTVLSASVMVESVTPDQALQVSELKKIAERNGTSVGLHLELDPAKPIEPQLEQRHKRFVEVFRFEPSHLDPHVTRSMKPIQARLDPAWAEMLGHIDSFAAQLGIPSRNMGDIAMRSRHTTQPRFFTIRFSFDEILRYLNGMKDGESYELMLHPGEYDPQCPSSLNRAEDYENAIKIHELLRKRPDVRQISYFEL